MEKEEDEVAARAIVKDPIQKYQFKYNESLCLTDKYPDISVNTKGSVDVAPGKGQIPKDIMTEMTIGI